MEIQYSGKAKKQFKKICRGDKKSGKMIADEIERYAENPSGNFDMKVLKGRLGEFIRLRVGDYRIIFDEEGGAMRIYEIKHRQGVYK